MKRIQRLLFYLLLLLLPTQLGRHFFFSFSQVSGIRSDYLTPTIFLTDVLIAVIVGIEIIMEFRMRRNHLGSGRLNLRSHDSPEVKGLLFGGISNKYLLFTIFYLLFTIIFIAANKWVALYKLVKIIEFILLGFVIVRFKPNLFTTLSILWFDTVYTSFIAVWQFIIQKSIGGWFWWLGERSFYASTPGIARFSFGERLFLRPYATFPHPNVMAGFLAVLLPIFLFVLLRQQSFLITPPRAGCGVRTFFFLGLLSGFLTLFLSFSRAAWLVTTLGFLVVVFRKWEIFAWFKKHRTYTIFIFYTLFILSIVLPLSFVKIFSWQYQSLRERTELLEGALKVLLTNPLFGVGLNNSVVKVYNFINKASGFYIFQPVHNVYLLVLLETGLVGFIVFTTAIMAIYQTALRGNFIVILGLTQILLLFFFDHYFFTLQQGQLLFTIFASFALSEGMYHTVHPEVEGLPF